MSGWFNEGAMIEPAEQAAYDHGVEAGRKQAYADVVTRMDGYLAACRKFGMDDKPVQKMADEIRSYR